jgi:hypothetical protein
MIGLKAKIPVLSTKKMVIRRQELGWHFLLLTTALGLYGGGVVVGR